MNLIVIGPQASGKGTQASLLKEKLGLFHLSTGVALREASKNKTDLGKRIKKYLEAGKLVPDEILEKVVGKLLTKGNLKKGIIFDGTPRVENQLFVLEEMLAQKKASIDRVIYIKLNKEKVLKRLSGRVVCDDCGKNYNLLTLPPKKEGICDHCEGRLKRRDDESPVAIKERLSIYQKDTLPILDLFRQKGILEEVNGERPIEVIFEDIMGRLKRAGLAK